MMKYQIVRFEFIKVCQESVKTVHSEGLFRFDDRNACWRWDGKWGPLTMWRN